MNIFISIYLFRINSVRQFNSIRRLISISGPPPASQLRSSGGAPALQRRCAPPQAHICVRFFRNGVTSLILELNSVVNRQIEFDH